VGALGTVLAAQAATPVKIFDGKSFAGWEGDTAKVWRIQDGALTGGSLTTTVKENDFLCTTRGYTNFILRLKFRLRGSEGFINAGVQVRSQRIQKPPNEMSGYQADMGDPEWWGCLYDESRRNKVLAKSDMTAVNRVLKRDDWNDYTIRCDGPRIQLSINGVQTVDYTEPEPAIPRHGLIGLQVHGGGKAEVAYKDLSIEELP
jgi:hypothetical protein